MLQLLNKEKINSICQNLTSKSTRHKNYQRQLSDLKYSSCGFDEYDNNTNADNSNGTYNDNNKNDDNIKGNTDNKYKNINSGDIQFCII